ncbi:protein of unknown function [bacterium A37T11]|nr:protein of unknown function [bacterium A37T11]
MNRYIPIIGGLLLLVSACAKKEEFEGTRTDVQLAASLAEYEQQLTSAENGWLAYLYPAGGGGYTFKFKFDANNRVVMYSDLNATYASTPKESSYRLKAVQVPSLYFDTYSYLHELADPDPAVSGGPVGEGQLSDFEFSFLSAGDDTIRLKGNLNESELVLVRAGNNQGDDYIAKAYAYNQSLNAFNAFPYYYNTFSLGGKDYNFTINTAKNTVSFYFAGNGFNRFTTEYASTENGIVFRNPFIEKGARIDGLSDFTFNTAAHAASVKAGGQTASISNQATPLVTDPDAATRMYVAPYQYTSDNGFTVNGVKDGYNISIIPGFSGCNFVPRQYADGYDAFPVFFNWGETFITPVFKTRIVNGKIYFDDIAGYSSNGDQAYVNIIMQFLQAHFTKLSDIEGYYVYQTAKNSFDLVSVSDSKVWMRLY